MDKLQKLRKALSEINVIEIYKNAVKQDFVQDSIVNLNIDQLQQGERTTGEKIRTYNSSSGTKGFYSSVTEVDKIKKGQPIDKVTIKDKGFFYETIEAEPNDNFVKVEADFQKDDGDISDNLDITDVLGLSDENKVVYAKKIILPIIDSTISGKLQNI